MSALIKFVSFISQNNLNLSLLLERWLFEDAYEILLKSSYGLAKCLNNYQCLNSTDNSGHERTNGN
jgi:hypothetical protein